jgi:MFS family permease
MERTKGFGKRGFVASWPQLLANVAVLGFSVLSGSQEQFLVWGWRVPFLLSALLVLVGLWIRLGILETPTFARLVEQGKSEQAPALEVFRYHPKPIFLSPLVRMSEQAPFYIFTAFVFTYGTQLLKLNRDLLLNAVTLFAVVEVFCIPFAGYLSDHIGRKRVHLIGVSLMFVMDFLFIALLNTKDPTLVVLGVMLGAIPHALQYRPQAALIA